MHRVRMIALVVLCLGWVGCGGDGLKRVSVRGKVTAKGVPIDHCTVQFLPLGSTKGQGGLGNSDEEGSFTMASGTLSGIVAGEYKVRLSRQIAPDGSPVFTQEQLKLNPQVRESVPRKYNGVESTPLKFTVPEGGGVLDIDIPEKLLPWKSATP